MKNDPGIQWIRDVRSTISNELGNDPQRFVAFHKEQQDARKNRKKEQATIAREKDEKYNDR